MAGVLYAKVNGNWVPTSPDEVIISDTPPPDGDIWVDTSTDPPSLKARIGGTWEPIVSGDEVWTGTGPPAPILGYELWYDTDPSATPGVPGLLRAWNPINADWEVVGGADEVFVGTTDPYLATPTGTWEVWHNTTDDPGTTFVRVADAWQQVTSREVFVDDQDPLTRVPPSPEAELWYDTTTGELKVQHPPGSWTVITASVHVPDEVTVSQAPPMDPQNELWVDTRTSPGILHYKDPVTGAWVPLGSDVNVPAPLDEVWVGPVDPRDASTELWYDVDAVPSTLGKTVPASLVEELITEVGNLKSRLAVLEAYVMNGVSV